MRIPENLKKCVFFVGVKEPGEGIDKIRYIGTAFVVSFPAKIPNNHFLFLVTAKHVLVSDEPRDYFIRANLKKGGAAVIALGNISWFYHAHETRPTDVAVYPFALPKSILQEIDQHPIPVANFLSDETRVSQDIGEGDEIFMVGLFSKHTGTDKNLPIIRMGTIAMIPDELVPTQKFGSIEAYLIEARSIKGLSGSPVFVLKQQGIKLADDVVVPSSRVTLHFFGLMHGHWDLSPGESIDVEDAAIGNESVNMGIAIVIPAKHILDTLNHPALVKWRNDQEANHVAKNAPIPDGPHTPDNQ